MGEITHYAKILIKELADRGIKAIPEYDDGHKSVDLFIKEVNLIIEVDGRHHTTSPEQALADLKRARYSLDNDCFTYHLPNSLVYKYPSESADLIKAMVKSLKDKKVSNKNIKSTPIPIKPKQKIETELQKEIKKADTSTETTDTKKHKKKMGFYDYIGLIGAIITFLFKFIIISIKWVLISVIVLFLLPIAFAVVSYVFFYALAIIVFIIINIFAVLFSFNALEFISHNSFMLFLSHIMSFFLKTLVPGLWRLVYHDGSRQVCVIVFAIIGLCIAVYKTLEVK